MCQNIKPVCPLCWKKGKIDLECPECGGTGDKYGKIVVDKNGKY